MPPKPRPLADRFWEKISRNPVTGCWEWQGARAPKGYGMFQVGGGRARRANRVAWELVRGLIPEGQHVCHRCDNPPCVNPDHLFLGTNLENRRDSVAKGRNARGERSGHAKLTDVQRAEIAALRDAGVPGSEIASRFGVTRGCVYALTPGKHTKPKKPCAEPECGRVAEKRGLCAIHYKRAWRAARSAALMEAANDAA